MLHRFPVVAPAQRGAAFPDTPMWPRLPVASPVPNALWYSGSAYPHSDKGVPVANLLHNRQELFCEFELAVVYEAEESSFDITAVRLEVP